MISSKIMANGEVYDIKVIVKGSGSLVFNNTFSVESNNKKIFTLKNNADINIKIIPQKGYLLEKLTVSGIDMTSEVKEMKLTLSDIRKNTVIVATFQPETENDVKLTLIALGKGDVIYGGTPISDTRKVVYVKEGTNIHLGIKTEKDSQLGRLTVNGISKKVSGNSYDFAIRQNTVVKASFESIAVKEIEEEVTYMTKEEESKKTNFSLGVTGPGTVRFSAMEFSGLVAGDVKNLLRENRERFYIPKEYPVSLSLAPVDNIKRFVIGLSDLTETVKGSGGIYTTSLEHNTHATIEFTQRYKVRISLKGYGSYEVRGELKGVKGKDYYLIDERHNGGIWVKVKQHYHLSSIMVNGVNHIDAVHPSNTIVNGFLTYDFNLEKVECDQTVIIMIEPDPILTISCGSGGTADRAYSINDPTSYVHFQDPDYNIDANETKSYHEPSAAKDSQFNGKPWILRMYAKENMQLSKITINGVDRTARVTRNAATEGRHNREISYFNLGIINKDTRVVITFTAVSKNTLEQAVQWVDLGTGVLWATTNVGAESPDKAGNYYTWDQAMKLPIQKGRLPTREEVRTLISQCRHEICTVNGIKGMRFYHRSNRSISIFLPAVGVYPQYNASNKLVEYGKEGAIWADSRSTVKEKIGNAYDQHSFNPLLLILGNMVGDFDRAALAYSVEEDCVECLDADKGARINVRLVLDK